VNFLRLSPYTVAASVNDPFRDLNTNLQQYTVDADDLVWALSQTYDVEELNPLFQSDDHDHVEEGDASTHPNLETTTTPTYEKPEKFDKILESRSEESDMDDEINDEISKLLALDIGISHENRYKAPVIKVVHQVQNVGTFESHATKRVKFVIHANHTDGKLSLWLGPVFADANNEKHPEISKKVLDTMPQSYIVMGGHLYLQD
jgi:hypothetical protein